MTNFPEHFERQYQLHPKHLQRKGLRPKTIDAYARGMRRIGAYFSYQVDDLGEDQLVAYFTDLMASHSWSGVKLDLYGLKFFTEHVLHKPWTMPRFIRSPKGNRDRLVPLPQQTLRVLREHWRVHQHPRLLFLPPRYRHARLGDAPAASRCKWFADACRRYRPNHHHRRQDPCHLCASRRPTNPTRREAPRPTENTAPPPRRQRAEHRLAARPCPTFERISRRRGTGH